MKLSIVHQEAYSRIELIVRFLFGSLYIVLPHSFLLFFIELWGTVLSFVAFWVVLFTGKYPRNMFEYQEKHLRWRLRVNARILNLCDGYPKFGLTAAEEDTNLEIPYPETLSRGLLLLRLFFGIFYVVIPHLFLLIFRILWGLILSFLAFLGGFILWDLSKKLAPILGANHTVGISSSHLYAVYDRYLSTLSRERV